MERSGLFLSHQYAYRKGVGTCDALLDVVMYYWMLSAWPEGTGWWQGACFRAIGF